MRHTAVQILIVLAGTLIVWKRSMGYTWGSLPGRLPCWLGLHWWHYSGERYRQCLREHCRHAEENLGFVGNAERWVTTDRYPPGSG